jgi:predicted HTH domain antitoxin
LEQYKNGDITIGRAAEIAKKSLREIMAIAAKRGIPFQYSLKSLREDAEALKKAK